MNFPKKNLVTEFEANGFVVVKIQDISENIISLKKLFEDSVHTNFNDN